MLLEQREKLNKEQRSSSATGGEGPAAGGGRASAVQRPETGTDRSHDLPLKAEHWHDIIPGIQTNGRTAGAVMTLDTAQFGVGAQSTPPREQRAFKRMRRNEGKRGCPNAGASGGEEGHGARAPFFRAYADQP